jgi:murein DD-endopeptidase MepM/ murein hydrolase activator NlpD
MPTLLQRYKSSERTFYKKVTAAFTRAFRRAATAWKRFLHGGRQSVSILVVAHTETPPRGIRISLFGLAGLGMMVAAIVVLAVAFSGGLGGARARVSQSGAELVRAQDELESLRAETSRLAKAYQDFETALEPIMTTAGTFEAVKGPKRGNVPSIFAKRSTEAQSLAEIRDTLDQTAPLVSEYGSMLGRIDSVKSTVPAIWPISGNIGHISTTFGTNPNPFTGQSYFHTGIDCSTYRSGDLIVSTGDGKVIFAGQEGGYGRCVIIAHAYGYMTRYGHMDRLLVRSGQTVKQGQGIGILGNSGVSTAPHTHYEVILGHNYLDPTDYLWSGAHSFPIITGGGSAD